MVQQTLCVFRGKVLQSYLTPMAWSWARMEADSLALLYGSSCESRGPHGSARVESRAQG